MYVVLLKVSEDELLCTVSFTKLRREYTSLSLATAHTNTGLMLEGETILVPFAKREKVEAYAAEAREPDAEARVELLRRSGGE